MVVNAPERNLEQRLTALDRANAVRTKRARLKKDIHAGKTDVKKLISDPPDFLHTMKLCDLVLAMPKYGRVKVNKVLKQCGISPSKTVGGLSARQRRDVIRFITR